MFLFINIIFINQCVQGENVVSCSIIWTESNLSFADAIVLNEEVNNLEYCQIISQFITYPEASVVVRIKFV